MIDLSDYDIEFIIENVWCVIDSVTGMTHIGVLVDDGDKSSTTLYSPRSVIEGESNQVVLVPPMFIGSSGGQLKLNCNTNNVQFTPCDDIIDTYIEMFLSQRESSDDTPICMSIQ